MAIRWFVGDGDGWVVERSHKHLCFVRCHKKDCAGSRTRRGAYIVGVASISPSEGVTFVGLDAKAVG